MKIADGAEQMGCFERVEVLASAASFYAGQKKYAEAERLLRRAVDLSAGLPNAQRSFQLQYRAMLARVLRGEGKDDEAEYFLAEAPPPALNTARGPDLTLAANDSMRVRQYKDQGNLQDAELFDRHAISALERVRGAGIVLAENLQQLADICHAEKRDVEAEELYRRALDLSGKKRDCRKRVKCSRPD